MTAPAQPPAREEIGHLADAALDRFVRPHLTAADDGKYILIDVDTGVYEIDTDLFAADERLKPRLQPGARLFLARAGHRAACRALGMRRPA